MKKFNEILLEGKKPLEMLKQGKIKEISDDSLFDLIGEFENKKWNKDNKDQVLKWIKNLEKELKKRNIKGPSIKPIFESKHEANREIHKNLKLGDSIISNGKELGNDVVLVLNNKTLEKNQYGYSLTGVKKITNEKFDIFLDKKELDYIAKNWKKLKG